MANNGENPELVELKADRADSSAQQNQWQNLMAAEIWSQQGCCNGAADQTDRMTLASADWLENRATERVKELATQYGLDQINFARVEARKRELGAS